MVFPGPQMLAKSRQWSVKVPGMYSPAADSEHGGSKH